MDEKQWLDLLDKVERFYLSQAEIAHFLPQDAALSTPYDTKYVEELLKNSSMIDTEQVPSEITPPILRESENSTQEESALLKEADNNSEQSFTDVEAILVNKSKNQESTVQEFDNSEIEEQKNESSQVSILDESELNDSDNERVDDRDMEIESPQAKQLSQVSSVSNEHQLTEEKIDEELQEDDAILDEDSDEDNLSLETATTLFESSTPAVSAFESNKDVIAEIPVAIPTHTPVFDEMESETEFESTETEPSLFDELNPKESEAADENDEEKPYRDPFTLDLFASIQPDKPVEKTKSTETKPQFNLKQKAKAKPKESELFASGVNEETILSRKISADEKKQGEDSSSNESNDKTVIKNKIVESTEVQVVSNSSSAEAIIEQKNISENALASSTYTSNSKIELNESEFEATSAKLKQDQELAIAENSEAPLSEINQATKKQEIPFDSILDNTTQTIEYKLDTTHVNPPDSLDNETKTTNENRLKNEAINPVTNAFVEQISKESDKKDSHKVVDDQNQSSENLKQTSSTTVSEIIDENGDIIKINPHQSPIYTPKYTISPMALHNELAACANLDELRALCEKHRDLLKTDLENTNLVFGVGNPHAKLMIVGEAPGENEDIQGEPFVGRAGQLLDKIMAAINFQRSDIYIANILKHRPPKNRDPLPDERDRSLPFLIRQIELIQPKIILCMGRISAKTLLGLPDNTTLAQLRGKFHPFLGKIELTATYHPAALLRNPKWKRPTWEDVKMVRKRYDELVN